MTHFSPDSSVKLLIQLADWKPKEVRLLNKYALDYERTPDYKKTLSAMIKFENMYLPVKKPSYYIEKDDYRKAINQERAYKRYLVYLNKKDLVKTVDKKGQKHLLVTSRGHKIFYEEYPLARLRVKKWDRNWTIVFYDIPEKIAHVRKSFRSKLINLGFGSPQISILVSPLPLSQATNELVKGEKLSGMVWVVRAKGVLGMKNREVAQKAWPLEELDCLYRLLLEILPKVRKRKNQELTDAWRHYFLSVNSFDPYLPFELLPKGWCGERCRRKFVRLGMDGLFMSILKRLF